MKLWYTSRTLWVNCIAVLALAVQSRFGFVVDAELQAALLAVVNVMLRIVTKNGLDWSNPAGNDTGHANLRLLFVIVALAWLAVGLSGCSMLSTSGQGKPALAADLFCAAHQGVVTTARGAATLCTAGKLDAAECLQADEAYQRARGCDGFPNLTFQTVTEGAPAAGIPAAGGRQGDAAGGR